MGVYVSEINMPEGEGSKLVLQIFQNGEVYDGHGIRLGIANWAKAVSIPPHGRLINADDTENITVIMNENGCGFNRIIAPIIIEAEEG